ncbi:MAG: protein-L-isoaspartate O-methyltransferase [Rhodospirillales bacterium RIFCSPLOWO2_12_FULL_67_15]|nr:MAG: protein-L-isoaspartate O-methyltransferase [Rhodospirillales bacterium RIFCSPLOWO2_12_FULL_67_15]
MAKQHQAMLDAIRADTADTASWTGRRALAPRVLAAMAKVERHRFVPESDAPYAYINRPRPIGHGQTISQPFIVALMTELLDMEPTDKVLEVGTGSGYQAAVLAELAREVFTIELVEPLGRMAETRLKDLGYANVHVRIGDGFKGWPEEAPFDAIIVTAAPEQVPEILAEQLKPGGRLVIPLGRQWEPQTLLRCVKGENGKLVCENKLPVAFVPMVRGKSDDGSRHLRP